MKNSLKQTVLVLAIIMILCMFKTTDFVSGNSYAFDMNELGITAGMNSEQRET